MGDLLDNWKNNKGYKNEVYLLPKELAEKVARLHLGSLGAELTVLSKEQADYIGVKVEGPFKPDTYRYYVLRLQTRSICGGDLGEVFRGRSQVRRRCMPCGRCTASSTFFGRLTEVNLLPK